MLVGVSVAVGGSWVGAGLGVVVGRAVGDGEMVAVGSAGMGVPIGSFESGGGESCGV